MMLNKSMINVLLLVLAVLIITTGCSLQQNSDTVDKMLPTLGQDHQVQSTLVKFDKLSLDVDANVEWAFTQADQKPEELLLKYINARQVHWT